MRQDFERRLERLEGVTSQHPQQAEAWIIDGNVSVNRATGEQITREDLEARPVLSNTLRIIRNVVDPNQED